ncbi:MAG: bacillithiol system redox-active protein YtxJ [Bacteroidota bacterium]
MICKELNHLADWNNLWNSDSKYIVFKHSTRCSISLTAWNKFQRNWEDSCNTPVYLLDLLNFREISNAISSDTGVMHESPQCLLIQNKQVLVQATHSGIYAEEFLV